MAMVTVTFGGEKVGDYPLDKPAVVVGRDATCDIPIDNLGVSRTHCQFIRRGNTYILQDMNSANGTYVNGRKIGEHYLNDGDEILIGKHALTFRSVGTAILSPRPQSSTDLGPEPMHTYMMEGDQIRERLAEMRAAGGPPDARTTPPQPVPAPPSGPSGSGPRRAIEHALDFDPLKPRGRAVTTKMPRPPAGGGSIKILLYASLVMNVMLMGLLAVLIYLIVTLMSRQAVGGAGAPSRPPAPAASSDTESSAAEEDGEAAGDSAEDAAP
jgi:predicted component of type VI protein secretion system